MTAITVPTFTLSAPSGTRICAIVPSSTASNSIVALSVSISASRSPDLTSSPSLTSHLASVPSSIVGERAGILSSMGIVAVVPVTWGGGACRYGFPPRHTHSPGHGPAGALAFHPNVTQSLSRKKHGHTGRTLGRERV